MPAIPDPDPESEFWRMAANADRPTVVPPAMRGPAQGCVVGLAITCVAIVVALVIGGIVGGWAHLL